MKDENHHGHRQSNQVSIPYRFNESLSINPTPVDLPKFQFLIGSMKGKQRQIYIIS